MLLGQPMDLRTLGAVQSAAASLAGRVRSKDPLCLRSLIAAVSVLRSGVRIDLHAVELAQSFDLASPPIELVTISCEVRLKRTGHTMRMIQSDGRTAGKQEPKQGLIRLIIKGRSWWEQLAAGGTDIASIARADGLTASYVTRVTRLAFLSPKVVAAILSGEQPVGLEGRALIAPDFPASWREQETKFLGS